MLNLNALYLFMIFFFNYIPKIVFLYFCNIQ